MSNTYKTAGDVPNEVLAKRLIELGHLVGEQNFRDFTMSVPAELDRDADLVLSMAGHRLLIQDKRNTELEAKLKSTDESYRAAFETCKDLHKDIAFLQSCANSGETAKPSDRPSQRAKEQECPEKECGNPVFSGELCDSCKGDGAWYEIKWTPPAKEQGS